MKKFYYWERKEEIDVDDEEILLLGEKRRN